jgi:hypothetical protein
MMFAGGLFLLKVSCLVDSIFDIVLYVGDGFLLVLDGLFEISNFVVEP